MEQDFAAIGEVDKPLNPPNIVVNSLKAVYTISVFLTTLVVTVLPNNQAVLYDI